MVAPNVVAEGKAAQAVVVGWVLPNMNGWLDAAGVGLCVLAPNVVELL